MFDAIHYMSFQIVCIHAPQYSAHTHSQHQSILRPNQSWMSWRILIEPLFWVCSWIRLRIPCDESVNIHCVSKSDNSIHNWYALRCLPDRIENAWNVCRSNTRWCVLFWLDVIIKCAHVPYWFYVMNALDTGRADTENSTRWLASGQKWGWQ